MVTVTVGPLGASSSPRKRAGIMAWNSSLVIALGSCGKVKSLGQATFDPNYSKGVRVMGVYKY